MAKKLPNKEVQRRADAAWGVYRENKDRISVREMDGATGCGLAHFRSLCESRGIKYPEPFNTRKGERESRYRKLLNFGDDRITSTNLMEIFEMDNRSAAIAVYDSLVDMPDIPILVSKTSGQPIRVQQGEMKILKDSGTPPSGLSVCGKRVLSDGSTAYLLL